MEKESEYNITKTDEELKDLISKLSVHLSENDFSAFCNVVVSRASTCWQSGLEEYAFGEMNRPSKQAARTILELVGLIKKSGTFDYNYTLYLKESICMYHKIYSREKVLEKLIKN